MQIDCYTPKVLRDLTLTPDRERPWEKVRAYLKTNDDMYVPRYYAQSKLGITPEYPDGPSMRPFRYSIDLNPAFQQPQAYAAVQDAWATTGGAVLSLPTGYGKTCVALKLAMDRRQRTLVVCHKTFLIHQWRDRILQFAPEALITYVQGDTCDVHGDFVLATVQTLVSRGYHTGFPGKFGVLIFDECHRVAAAVFSTVMFGCTCKYTLGLSATPERKDDLGPLVEWFLGPVCLKVAPSTRPQKPAVYVLHYASPTYAKPPPTNAKGTVCYTTLMTQVSQDPERLRFVASVVRNLRAKKVLVLCHRRGMCQALAEALADMAPELKLGGRTQKPGVPSRLTIATFALVSEGFDDPDLTALVFATPASDVVQACGRVGRGTDPGVIVDIVDGWGPCYAQASKRRRFYTTAGLKVSKCSVDGLLNV